MVTTQTKYFTIQKHRIPLHQHIKKMTEAQLQLLAENTKDVFKDDPQLYQKQLDEAKQMHFYIWEAPLKSLFDIKDEQLMQKFQQEGMFQKAFLLVGNFAYNDKKFGVKEIDNDDALANLKTDLKLLYQYLNPAQK